MAVFAGANEDPLSWIFYDSKGALTGFYKATQARDDETPIFSWVEYPDKATRDAANRKMSEDADMANMEMPFDGKRMFWGGFQQVVNE